MAWLGTWAKRVKLTTDNGDIDSALSNFPILLYISTSSGQNSEDISFVFDELTADANRKKIAVTTSDGETQCYAEIEKWDDANEKAWLWVKAPSISNSADTDFYLYYDASQSDNDSYVGDTNDEVAENVWDSNFKAVHHMRDGADTSSTYDSTSNDKDGTKKGAAEPAVTTSGKISDAQHFDGSDDYLSISNTVVSTPSEITWEMWFKSDVSDTTEQRTIGFENTDVFIITSINSGTANLIKVFINGDSGGGWHAGTTSFTVTDWHYIVGRAKENDYLNLFIDGNDIGTPVAVTTFGGDATGNPFYIGTGRDGASQPTDGIIDEVRISNKDRGADWLKATYETERDDLLDWGSEETISIQRHGFVNFQDPAIV